MRVLLAGVAVALGATGCGSAPVAELPPPVPRSDREPPGVSTARGVEGGRLVAAVRRRARIVETYDARTGERVAAAPAGVGPAGIASNGRQLLFVADTAGDGLLVLHTRPRLEVFRRVAFPGGAPYAVAHDAARGRVWVALRGTNEVAELNSGTRPGILRRYPVARRPVAVAVDPATGRVTVTGAGGERTVVPVPPVP